MSIANTLQKKLQQELTPLHLEIENESHMHSGPATESHFKITVVSDAFDGMMLIKQHRLVNQILKAELEQIHALALHTYTTEKWAKRNNLSPDSPACAGGSKSH